LVKSASEEEFRKSSGFGQKIAFWLIICLALPLILSIVLIMLPIFGTHSQEFFLSLHRYTAMVFSLVVIVHTYLLIRSRMKQ
jgi:cytochrome b subunit of formate dehydrogenase